MASSSRPTGTRSASGPRLTSDQTPSDQQRVELLVRSGRQAAVVAPPEALLLVLAAVVDQQPMGQAAAAPGPVAGHPGDVDPARAASADRDDRCLSASPARPWPVAASGRLRTRHGRRSPPPQGHGGTAPGSAWSATPGPWSTGPAHPRTPRQPAIVPPTAPTPAAPWPRPCCQRRSRRSRTVARARDTSALPSRDPHVLICGIDVRSDTIRNGADGRRWRSAGTNDLYFDLCHQETQ